MQLGHSICFCLVIYLFADCFQWVLVAEAVKSLSFWRETKKCSAHPLNGPQLLTRSQKSVQMVSYSTPSFSLPSSWFLLWITHLLVLCFQKRTKRTTWFQLWKWKAKASVWCFSILVYRHIKHKEGKRRKKEGGGGGGVGGTVKGFATTT